MIHPTETQLEAFFAADQGRPVAFVNCHRYFKKARYPESFDDENWTTDVSGFEAYHRYLERVESDYMPQVGGRFLIAGPAEVLIGDSHWEEVIIGEYPSRSEAFRLPTLPGYDEIAVHREAGLEAALTLALDQDSLYRVAVSEPWRDRI